MYWRWRAYRNEELVIGCSVGDDGHKIVAEALYAGLVIVDLMQVSKAEWTEINKFVDYGLQNELIMASNNRKKTFIDRVVIWFSRLLRRRSFNFPCTQHH